MPLDPNIALGFKQPDFGSPVNDLAQIMQLQGFQQANQLNGMKLQQQQAANDRQNKLYALMAGLPPETTDDQRSAKLKGAGFFEHADTLDKNILERRKIESEGLARKATALKDYTGVSKELATRVMAQPTLENAMAAVKQAAAYHKFLGFGDLDTSNDEQSLSQMTTPEQIKKWAAGHALQAEKLMPKLTDFAAGDYHYNQAIDPVTGLPTQTGRTVIGQSADNKATVGASLANAAATREVAKSNVEAARIQTGFNNEQSLRKEFEGLPEVKNYKQAYPAYAAIKDAATRNTPQADINLVYGIAKLYDPTSVVREGEYATVANSPNIPEKIKGYAQYLAGGGRLTPEVKAQIVAEAEGRIGTYQAEAKKARGSYEGIAKQRGMNPQSVFADMGDMNNSPSGLPDMSAIDAEIARRRKGK